MKTKNKLHIWYVNAGMYYKQLPTRAEGMEESRQKAYQKLISMSYEEFKNYIPLQVSGMKDSFRR